MWEFRHEGRSLEAKVSDLDWLRNFRDGVVVLHPGDALRAVVDVTVRYGCDGEVVSASYTIVKVMDVVPRSEAEQRRFDTAEI
jgi:hypothetical protein